MIIKGYFCSFLHKNICCGYSLEIPRRSDANDYPQHSEAILMNTHNICFFLWRTVERKLSFNYHQIPSLSGLLTGHFVGFAMSNHLNVQNSVYFYLI